MSNPFDYLGKIVSFTVYPSAIIGTSFENVKILAILDADSAVNWIDPVSMHKLVYVTIPLANRPANDPKSYHYYKIQMPDESIQVIGIPWIDGALTVHESQQVTIVVNNTTPDKVAALRKMLVAAGESDFTITVN